MKRGSHRHWASTWAGPQPTPRHSYWIFSSYAPPLRADKPANQNAAQPGVSPGLPEGGCAECAEPSVCVCVLLTHVHMHTLKPGHLPAVSSPSQVDKAVLSDPAWVLKTLPLGLLLPDRPPWPCPLQSMLQRTSTPNTDPTPHPGSMPLPVVLAAVIGDLICP
jgi:hypothetical protein